MDEVASVSVDTKQLVFKTAALLCFVFRVVLIVLTQLVKSVSEFASFFVGTVAIFHKLFAEL